MKNAMIKRIVDVCMTILLLCLMAYQVTGEAAHEWIGIGMTVLVIIHQILNRKWYGAIFRGKYNPYRIVTTVVNIALLLSFALTAFCGMSMSGHAVPFLYGMTQVSFARRMHLSMSHWAFVLMGLHLGMHIPVMIAKLKLADKLRLLLSVLLCIASGIGLFLFIRSGMPNYLFFRVPFAFLDYEKAGVLVFLENILMLTFWAYTGTQIAILCRNAQLQTEEKKNPLLPVIYLMAAIIIGLVLNMISGGTSGQDFGGAGWNSADPEVMTSSSDTAGAEDLAAEHTDLQPSDTAVKTDPGEIQDGFLLINGGSFLMGSPDSENWRIEDEVQHEVTVSSFYIDPYETTQEEYERLMGENPSTFIGEKLPADKSIDASGANFYGHYPYEIEENYFNDSVLEARPGEYRQTTVEVGSFEPNAWGLYDCHGNVNEWCWDYYGDYDLNARQDPTGVNTGTRHVYRGGGWNDFAKNMRSAYRAAGQTDLASYNLGVRLVRNADSGRAGTVTAMESVPDAKTGGRVLIAYFSWSGNTRGIAQEIQSRTGADLFEISPVKPYSSDYNTVLMEAQEDQHNQARPELSDHIENMDEYDTILLGYPNWWASIPMPIASFLEEYDFSGKRIVPFCSHGGGRFGQSLTAIAKLAPDADLGEGLSVHYSGGSTLSEDIQNWLDSNGINK